jgi:hypothetical protein
MKYIFIILPFFLTGCAAFTSPTVVTNKVPIVIPCTTSPPEDSILPLDSAKPEEGLFRNTKKALATIEVLKGDLEKYKAAFKSCK